MGRKKDITDSTEHKKIITVTAVTALNDYMLKVTFSSKETKIFDFKPYLSAPAFTHTWDENTDISTDLLYFEGITLEDYYK